jgi:hypothetical protein
MSHSLLERLRTRPLPAPALLAVTGAAWVAGALYCSGYERLLSGIDNWPGSLVWSAVAVLPWLALFEWSKTRSGQRLISSSARLVAAIVATGAVSLLLGRLIDAADGHSTALALSVLRRLPPAGVGLLLVLWSRPGGAAQRRDREAEASLASLAGSIDWVEAADNYVELHVGGRTVMRRMTMREAQQALAGRGFVRIHRRFLVNGRKIAAISASNGDRTVRLSDGVALPVGRTFAANLIHAA